jgi:hypothetical protein
LKPDLVKVDVEGLELDVLEDGIETLSSNLPALIVETHDKHHDVKQFLNKLAYARYAQVGRSFAASPTFPFVARLDQKRRATPYAFRQAVTHTVRGGKQLVRRVPGAIMAHRRTRQLPVDVRNTVDTLLLRLKSGETFRPNENSNLVVSLTSFPARIKHAWISIETVFRQNFRPSKVVLVLAADEFPGKVLPKLIREQEERGLESLWVRKNIGSYKKLFPTRSDFPKASIVTIDDNLFHEPWLLARLVDAADANPSAIVGHRGWVVCWNGSTLAPYADWPSANRQTPSHRVFLTSGAGMLFPPGALSNRLLLGIDLAEKLCPQADDIWYWGVAAVSGAPMICLGNHALRPIRAQRKTPQLKPGNVNQGGNDRQLNNAMDHFDLRTTFFRGQNGRRESRGPEVAWLRTGLCRLGNNGVP